MGLLTSAPISALAIELLRRQLVLVNTVARVPGGEYSGRSGGTVTLAVPSPRTALEHTAGETITFADIDEVPVDVTVKELYDATRVDDRDLTMAIEDFGRQVLRPQIAAVAQGAEDELAAAMNALDPDESIEWATDPDPDADEDTILAIRERMGDDGVPAGDRYVAVSTDIARRLLAIDKFTRADARGSSTALEHAIIGDLYGLTFVESAGIDKGAAVAYHQTGFAFGSLPPVIPPNVDGSTVADGGVALRHILAFSTDRLATASVASVFVGAAVVPEDEAGTEIKRAIRVEAVPAT